MSDTQTFPKRWQLERDERTTSLRVKGPGTLELVLLDFDPARIQRTDALMQAPAGLMWQAEWAYALDACQTLTLRSTTNLSQPQRSPLHVLRLGAASWVIPGELAEALHALGTDDEA